jgi:hypothetical protein
LKKPLTAALLTAAAVSTLAVPAGAAVPQHRQPTQTLACGKKTAQLWNTGWLVAAKNPCRQWLIIRHFTASQSDPGPAYMSVAPGAHFSVGRLDWNELGESTDMHLAGGPNCDGNLYLRNSHGKPSYC